MNTHISRGFTLIELMVTLSVVAILASVAVPGFRSIIDNNRATTASNDVLASLLFARSEAVKRAREVTVCPNPAGTAECPDEAAWQEGWVVYYEDDDGEGQLLRVVNALPASVTMTGPEKLIYAAAGNRKDAPDNFLLSVGEVDERRVCLEASGRAEVRKGAAEC